MNSFPPHLSQKTLNGTRKEEKLAHGNTNEDSTKAKTIKQCKNDKNPRQKR